MERERASQGRDNQKRVVGVRAKRKEGRDHWPDDWVKTKMLVPRGLTIFITPQWFQSFFLITDTATYRLNQPRGQII